jgi:hypothetical protein
MADYLTPYKLLKEARESWDYLFTDKLVYAIEPGEVQSPKGQSIELKAYINTDFYFETILHMKYNYAVAIVEGLATKDSRKIRGSYLRAEETWNDSLMLIDAVQFMEPPQMLNFRPIRSVVRLKLFDNTKSIREDIPSSCLSVPVAVCSERVENRELRSTIRFIRLDVDDGELPGQMVECCPEVESKIANENTPTQRRLLSNFKTEDLSRLFRVFFWDKSIWFQLMEVPDFLIQEVEVFLRPINL